MATRKDIRTALDGATSMAAVGRKLGLSRERVRQLFEKYRLPKPHPIISRCSRCGRKVSGGSREIGLCVRCRYIDVVCGQCSKTFRLPLRVYHARFRLNAGVRKGKRWTPLFCSRRCWGLWVAARYGFKQVYPTRAAAYEAQLKQSRAYYYRRKAQGLCPQCGAPRSIESVYCEEHRYRRKCSVCGVRCYGKRCRACRTHTRSENPRMVEVECTICSTTYSIPYFSLIANRVRHGSDRYYCPSCRPKRPHIHREKLGMCSLCSKVCYGKYCRACYIQRIMNTPKWRQSWIGVRKHDREPVKS